MLEIANGTIQLIYGKYVTIVLVYEKNICKIKE